MVVRKTVLTVFVQAIKQALWSTFTLLTTRFLPTIHKIIQVPLSVSLLALQISLFKSTEKLFSTSRTRTHQ